MPGRNTCVQNPARKPRYKLPGFIYIEGRKALFFVRLSVDKKVMNEIPVKHEILINSFNDGILKELLPRTESYNVLWGSEYILMGENYFIEDNANEIIEIMVKTKTFLPR